MGFNSGFKGLNVVGHVVAGRCQRPATTCPTTFHACKTRGCQCSLGGVSPETCWASYKYAINFDTLLHLVGFFIWIILWCTDPWTSDFHNCTPVCRRLVCSLLISWCTRWKTWIFEFTSNTSSPNWDLMTTWRSWGTRRARSFRYLIHFMKCEFIQLFNCLKPRSRLRLPPARPSRNFTFCQICFLYAALTDRLL